MLFLGVDPGVSGGIAVIDTVSDIVEARKMPATERELLDTVGTMTEGGKCFGFLEKLGGMPRSPDGRAMQSPKTMLVMGTNYGMCRMALVAAEVSFDEVLPRTWQKHFSLVFPAGKYTSTQKKNLHKQKAERMFPGVKVTHHVADALLIAEYCRRLHSSNGEQNVN